MEYMKQYEILMKKAKDDYNTAKLVFNNIENSNIDIALFHLQQAVEKSLKAFEGLDADKAKQALQTIQNLDAKKLVDAGDIEKVKAELTDALKKSYEPQIQQLTQERDAVQSQLHKELIGGGFARSKFIQEKIAVPADMIQATFGNNFKIEDGKVVAYGVDGQKIYSRTKHGEVADFDEALETLVGGYQHKDSILKGNQSTGGGYGGQGGGGNNNNVGNMGGSIQERQAAIAAKFNLDK